MSISRRSAFCFLFIAGFGNQLRAQSLNTSKLDSLCTAIETNDRSMFSLAIAKSGHIVYQRAVGSSNIDGTQQKHATPETEYRIGSVSKMFTAVMILQLVEEKKLKLSTPLAKFFPSIPHAKQITIEQMLGHRSGLYDFTRDSNFGQWMTEPRTHDQMVTVIATGKPMFAPDAQYEYSNSNYVLLGYIVERVTKHPYAEELAKRITRRIGLDHTYLGG